MFSRLGYKNDDLALMETRTYEFCLSIFNLGLIKFLVLINIHSFVFNPYKIKSHFLVLIKFSISIFSPYKKFPAAFLVSVKNFHQHFWFLKCLRKMSQGLKSVILFCRD